VVRKSFESTMPEVMALLKLKGFISDLGGEVVESVPGMIRVRVPDQPEQKSAGLLAWMGGARRPTTEPPVTELELHMERKTPAKPNLLTITLVLRPGNRPIDAAWDTRCGQIVRDLQAYLMG
jgi:serine/threonine-protein kinase